jgi:hypothetical protein
VKEKGEGGRLCGDAGQEKEEKEKRQKGWHGREEAQLGLRRKCWGPS